MAQDKIPVQMFEFAELMQEAITASTKLIDYFRMNLIYFQLISGKGLEFDRVKQYAIGDDPRRMDWGIFAKTGELFIRAFKEERHFDIVFVIDVSDTMLLGTTDKTKNQYAAIVAGALGYAAIQADDQIAVVLVSDEHSIAIDPTGDFFSAMHVLADRNNYGGKKDWNKVITSTLGNYGEDAIIFILSDFIDTDPDTFLPVLGSHFTKVYGVMIQDPVDISLPEGVGRMYLKNTLGTYSSLTNFDNVRDEYEVLSRHHMEKIRNKFHEYDGLFFRVTTGDDFATAFVKAFGEEEVIIS